MPPPAWIEPMAATLTEERFTDPAWTFERKLDGIRVLAFKDGSRVGSSVAQPPAAARSPIGPSRRGRGAAASTRRSSTARRRRVGPAGSRRLPRVRRAVARRARPATALPLDERRALLDDCRSAAARAVEPLDGDRAVGARACREGWEGVIAKRRDSPYESRRSRHWLKMKCEATQELVVGGFTDPQGSASASARCWSATSRATTSSSPARSAPASTPRCCTTLRARLDAARDPEAAVHEGTGLPRSCARTGCARDRRAGRLHRVDRHGKLRHPRLLGSDRQGGARGPTRERA